MEDTKKTTVICKHPREIEQMLVKALAAFLFATQRKTFLTQNTHT